MAIYRMVGEKEKLSLIPETTFAKEKILERDDLQRILRDQPEVLENGLFILSEEFSQWHGSGRSIDLLGIDATGRLTVIELKRTEKGDHSELQAIRYAAMVANMTLDQAVVAHQAYLNKRSIIGSAEERVQQHLDTTEYGELQTERPRIVVVSGGFSTELTTCVLWLNDSYGLDINCIRLQPYRNGAELLVESSQIIPLPEAADYLVRIREREDEQRRGHRTEPGETIPGGDAFLESIGQAPEQFQAGLENLYQWAIGLENEGLTKLDTRQGKALTSLRLVLPQNGAVPVTVYDSSNGLKGIRAYIQLRRSSFYQYAPKSVPLIEELTGLRLGEKQFSQCQSHEVTDELLAALTAAYREANGLVGDDGRDGK